MINKSGGSLLGCPATGQCVRTNRRTQDCFCPDIVDFDVEDGSDCLYDVLTIRAEAPPEATSSIDVRELNLCGNSWKGESLFFNETTHQEIVNLEFKTNEFFSRRGFLLALAVSLS